MELIKVTIIIAILTIMELISILIIGINEEKFHWQVKQWFEEIEDE